MALVMTYGATVFTCSRDPSIEGYITSRQWWNPSVRAGGKKLYVYEKTPAFDIVTLTWGYIDPTDLTNLRAFLTAAGRDLFEVTLPDGRLAMANFWGPSKLLWTPIELVERDFTIELLISQDKIATKHDTVTLSDVFSRVVPFVRSVNDSISLSDILLFKFNGSWILNPPPADNISLSDARVESFSPATKSESISLSDSMHMRFGISLGYLTDESGNYITDESGNYIIVGSGKWIKAAADIISMTDAFGLVNSTPYYLTDESTNNITDESGNKIICESAVSA